MNDRLWYKMMLFDVLFWVFFGFFSAFFFFLIYQLSNVE